MTTLLHIETIYMTVAAGFQKLRGGKGTLLNTLYFHLNIEISTFQYSLVCDLLVFKLFLDSWISLSPNSQLLVNSDFPTDTANNLNCRKENGIFFRIRNSYTLIGIYSYLQKNVSVILLEKSTEISTDFSIADALNLYILKTVNILGYISIIVRLTGNDMNKLKNA